MRPITIILILTSALSLFAQSRRVNPSGTPAPAPAGLDLTVKQMYDEVSGFRKARVAEYELKKIPYSERLRLEMERERRQLAAKYATIAGARTDLTVDDIYSVAMLHWIAENLDAASDFFKRYLASKDQVPEKTQSSRAILSMLFSKQKKFDEALKFLSEFENGSPAKVSERWRVNSEVAKAYIGAKEF